MNENARYTKPSVTPRIGKASYTLCPNWMMTPSQMLQKRRARKVDKDKIIVRTGSWRRKKMQSDFQSHHRKMDEAILFILLRTLIKKNQPDEFTELTERELEILDWTAQGHNITVISNKLCLSI